MVGWDDQEISHHDLRAGACSTFAPKQQVKHRKALNASSLANLREGTRLISEEWIAEKKRKLKDAEVKAAPLHSFSSWEQKATHTLHSALRGLLWMLLEPPGPPESCYSSSLCSPGSGSPSFQAARGKHTWCSHGAGSFPC